VDVRTAVCNRSDAPVTLGSDFSLIVQHRGDHTEQRSGPRPDEPLHIDAGGFKRSWAGNSKRTKLTLEFIPFGSFTIPQPARRSDLSRFVSKSTLPGIREVGIGHWRWMRAPFWWSPLKTIARAALE
jgi:hypothetical protein